MDKQQKKRVKKLLKEYQKGIKRYSELREDIIKEKRALFLSDDLNKERLKKLSKRLHEFASEIEANFVENMHKILDQKQRMRFSKYIYEWEVE
ncbi:MAG: hypothetical protein L3J47_06680 [Sulfurovum sp.]|nr:hypothetical protein [Sulfurovum sp.]